jgi:hypothetical protein
MKSVYKQSCESSHQNEPRGQVGPNTSQIRWFLVRSVVVLMFGSLVVYMIVRDPIILGMGDVIFLVAIVAVFNHYFPRKSKSSRDDTSIKKE